jgi:hypothetical protein
MEAIEMPKKPLSSIQKTQLEMSVMKTRGNIEDYISNPYWLINNNISKDIVYGTLGPANTMELLPITFLLSRSASVATK